MVWRPGVVRCSKTQRQLVVKLPSSLFVPSEWSFTTLAIISELFFVANEGRSIQSRALAYLTTQNPVTPVPSSKTTNELGVRLRSSLL